MPMSRFLEQALANVQEAQDHYPQRQRSYNKINLPGSGITTAEKLHRQMMDVIILRNALLAWKGEPINRPELGDGFIYERDISPYTDYLLSIKSMLKPVDLSEESAVHSILRTYLNKFRDFEALNYEVEDKVLTDISEHDLRLARILSISRQ